MSAHQIGGIPERELAQLLAETQYACPWCGYRLTIEPVAEQPAGEQPHVCDSTKTAAPTSGHRGDGSVHRTGHRTNHRVRGEAVAGEHQVSEIRRYLEKYGTPGWELVMHDAGAYYAGQTGSGRVMVDKGGFRAEWTVNNRSDRKMFATARAAIGQVMSRCDRVR